MKHNRKTLHTALVLLLTLCCLWGSMVPAAASGISYQDLEPMPQVITDDSTEDPETDIDPETIVQKVTLIHYSVPSTVGVGETATITATPDSFIYQEREGRWFGESNNFYYVLSGITAESKDESILRVSSVTETSSGWEISVVGVSAGKASISLTVHGEVYSNEYQYENTISKTTTASVTVVGQEATGFYVLTSSDDNGTASPKSVTVPENGKVTLTFNANDGYVIDNIQICTLEGKVLRQMNLAEGKLQTRVLELDGIEQSLLVKLATVEGDPGLTNPFKDLNLEDFVNPFEDLKESDWYYAPVAFMTMAGMFDGIDFETYLNIQKSDDTKTDAAEGTVEPFSYQTFANSGIQVSTGTSSISTLSAGASATTGSKTAASKNTAAKATTAKTSAAKNATTKTTTRKPIKFHPQATGTRVVTVMELHNASGNLNLSSGSYTKSPFADVTSNLSCFQAVLWASDKNIVRGYGNGYFGTYDNITREQMCAILLRTAKKAGMTLPETYSAKNFTDSGSISSWAKSAVTACSKAGIINGYPDGSFKPKNNIAQSEIANMIYKFLNLLP